MQFFFYIRYYFLFVLFTFILSLPWIIWMFKEIRVMRKSLRDSFSIMKCELFQIYNNNNILASTNFLSSSSISCLLLARAKILNLHLCHEARWDTMYGRRMVRPPSSYNHHTSKVPDSFTNIQSITFNYENINITFFWERHAPKIVDS